MPESSPFKDRVEAALGLVSAMPPQPDIVAVPAEPEDEPEAVEAIALPDGTIVPLADLQSAYAGRQQIDRAREAVMADRARVQALHAALEDIGDPNLLALMRRPPPEWESLSADDPPRYMADMAALDHGMRRRAAAQAAFEAERMHERAERLAFEHARLSEKLPDWQDAAKRSALGKEIAAFLKAEGFDDRQIGEVLDHRTLLVIRKAMLWDRMQADAASGRAKQVGQGPTPTVRPVPAAEAAGPTKVQRLVERARKTGRVGDRVAALEALMQ